MALKDWFERFQPIQLYIVLVLTILLFITELICSHITHALTLLVDSYHLLCNILALSGCIITIKYGKLATCLSERRPNTASSVSSICDSVSSASCSDKKPNETKMLPSRTNQENKLKNTFGWARIDVISMLITCIFIASLSFSVLVEAFQTLVHIGHSDAMHHPLSVFFIGCAGLLLNGVCFLLIGGYTFHQGSFLYVTESGDVVLNRVIVADAVKQGGRRLSRTRVMPPMPVRQREGCWEMFRDILGTILVIICALLVYFTDKDVAKFVDPLMSIVSAFSLVFLSYPYMKESCLILLQTIPGSINIDALKKDLLNQFPDIVNVHDFHVWQLTATKIISTVHIIFQKQKGYSQIMEEIRDFLLDNGITQVTIQPEFTQKIVDNNSTLPSCLMACQGEGCKLNHCCPIYDEKELGKRGSKASSKEILALRNSLPDLRSVKTIDDGEVRLTNDH